MTPPKKTLSEINALTFEQIDKENGFTPLWDTPPDNSWFNDWYSGIYKMPFAKLDDDDLIRICQQTWNKEYFVPVALQRLAVQPFIDGITDNADLLVALGTKTPVGFWRENSALFQEFCRILNDASHRLRTEAEHNEVTECMVFDDGSYVFDDTFVLLRDVQARLSYR